MTTQTRRAVRELGKALAIFALSLVGLGVALFALWFVLFRWSA